MYSARYSSAYDTASGEIILVFLPTEGYFLLMEGICSLWNLLLLNRKNFLFVESKFFPLRVALFVEVFHFVEA